MGGGGSELRRARREPEAVNHSHRQSEHDTHTFRAIRPYRDATRALPGSGASPFSRLPVQKARGSLLLAPPSGRALDSNRYSLIAEIRRNSSND